MYFLIDEDGDVKKTEDTKVACAFAGIENAIVISDQGVIIDELGNEYEISVTSYVPHVGDTSEDPEDDDAGDPEG